MKTYATKHDIYKDYPVAIKFCLERHVHVSDYEKLFDSLSDVCRARIDLFSRSVKNYQTDYPLSVGLFIEIPVTGDTGQTIGTRFVLLEHETGWELFIPIAKTIAEKVIGKSIDKPLTEFVSFMKLKWLQLIHGGVRIDHVEIRTENKGVMCIPFSDFEVEQMECFMSKFSLISHIRDCNNDCFGGLLVAPLSNETKMLASD